MGNLFNELKRGQPNGIYRAELEFMVGDKVYQKNDFKFTVGIISLSSLLASGAGAGPGTWLIVLGVILLVIAGAARIRKDKAVKKLTLNLAAKIRSLF